jgi:hypothetical protein
MKKDQTPDRQSQHEGWEKSFAATLAAKKRIKKQKERL